MRWFYNIDGDRRGPISSSELKQLAERGQVRPDDLVMAEGDPQWKFAREAVPVLFQPRPTDGALLAALAAEREAEALEQPKSTVEAEAEQTPKPKRKGIVCKVCDEGILSDRSLFRAPLPVVILGVVFILSAIGSLFLMQPLVGLVPAALGALCLMRKRVLVCDHCGAAIAKL